MPALLVSRPTGTLDASGSGYVESQVHSSAAHTSIDQEYRISLSKSHDLFTAISWADVNTEGNVDASSGETEFVVSMDQQKFADALAYVIQNAIGGVVSGGFSVSTNVSSVPAAQTYSNPDNMAGATAVTRTVLDRQIRKEVEAELDANGVLEYLEGDSLGGFSLAIDASGAGLDMAEKLADVSNTTDNALRNLFLQIPNRTTILSLTDSSGDRLPVMEGDAIAFIFTTQPEVKIEQRDESSNNFGTTGAGANPLGTANMVVDNATSLTTSVRKIAYIIDVVA